MHDSNVWTAVPHIAHQPSCTPPNAALGVRHGTVGAAVACKSPREQSRSWSERECAIVPEPLLHTSVAKRHHGADKCRSRDRRIYSVEHSGQDRRDGRLRQSKRAREFQRSLLELPFYKACADRYWAGTCNRMS